MLDGGGSEGCILDVGLAGVTKDRGELVLKNICYVFRIGFYVSILIKKKVDAALFP